MIGKVVQGIDVNNNNWIDAKLKILSDGIPIGSGKLATILGGITT